MLNYKHFFIANNLAYSNLCFDQVKIRLQNKQIRLELQHLCNHNHDLVAVGMRCVVGKAGNNSLGKDGSCNRRTHGVVY